MKVSMLLWTATTICLFAGNGVPTIPPHEFQYPNKVGTWHISYKAKESDSRDGTLVLHDTSAKFEIKEQGSEGAATEFYASLCVIGKDRIVLEYPFWIMIGGTKHTGFAKTKCIIQGSKIRCLGGTSVN